MALLVRSFVNRLLIMTQQEADDNYARQKAIYAAQLQRRLSQGQITQSFYDKEMASIRDSLPDASDAYWNEFLGTVAAEVTNPLTAVNNDVALFNGDVTGINDQTFNNSNNTYTNTAFSDIGNALKSYNPLAALKQIYSDGTTIVKLYFVMAIAGLIVLIFFRKPLVKFLSKLVIFA